MVIEPQRQALIPGLRGRARGRAGGRRARLLDLGRRADRVRLVRGADARRRCATAMVAAFRAQRTRRAIRGSPRRAAPARDWSTADAVRQHTRRGARGTLSARRSRAGIAPDGGLYVPESPAAPRCARRSPARSLIAAVAQPLLAPFFAGDRAASASSTRSSTRLRFSRAARPLVDGDGRRVLELFHGPDRGVQGFRRALPRRLPGAAARRRDRSRSRSWSRPRATPAARSPRRSIAGRVPGRRCCIRSGLVSPRQEQQLTCWGDNVRTLRVRGTFDDCQRLVKEAFADEQLRARIALSRPTASTSAGCCRRWRTTPRRAWTSRARPGRRASFIVPSGNLGNAMACVWARDARAADRRHRARAQCQSRGARLLRNRRVAAARERRDARVRDGRGRSEQHGAVAHPVSRSGGIASRARRGERG